MTKPASDIESIVAFHSPALETAPVAIYAIDLSFGVCFWNKRSAALFGWSAEEALGEPVRFVARANREAALLAIDQLLAGTPFVTGEFTAIRRDGHRFPMVGTSSLLRDAAGEPAAILTLARDLTADAKSAEILESAEYKWRLLALRASDTITVADADGHVVESTGEMKPMLGYPSGWWKGKSGFELIHPDDLTEAAETWAWLAANRGETTKNVFRTRHHDGHYELVEFTGVNLLDDPVVKGIVVSNRNVSMEKQAELLLADEARILELIARDCALDDVLPAIVKMIDYHTSGTSGIFLSDPTDRRVHVSTPGDLPPELIALVERSPMDFGEENETADASVATSAYPRFRVDTPATIIDFATDPRTTRYAQPLIDLGYRGCWSVPIIEQRTKVPFGFIATYMEQPRPPTDHERRVQERAGHLAAIAVERAGWQRDLWQQARYDTLTGLPNRASILEALDDAVTEARIHTRTALAMLIDLDRFKIINDSLGHAVGDLLIREFADRLLTVIGDAGFVGRVGADEFVVIFPVGASDATAHEVGTRLGQSLDEPFIIEGDEIYLTCSMGLASSTGREQADTLLQRADMAMFKAKGLGRARIVRFDDTLRAQTVARMQIDRDLRLAVERNELVLHYQPEVDLASGAVVGCEALLRWQHPVRGLTAPDEFIHAAEETGIIIPIGYWVLDEAIRQARLWTEELPSLDPFMVNVNLSARQLTTSGLVDTVAFALTRYNWPPSHLTLELTESIVIEDHGITLSALDRLRQLGVKLAIDDFGTGFASLDYLHRLHVDMIKIDRSFVTPLDENGEGSPVAAAMLSMARAFDLKVCAEGVETEAQAAGLRALKCDLAQGFLFAKGLPADEFVDFVRSHRTW